MNFSLIICTYMRPKSLLALLDTVVIQSLYPDEIIIVDGSTDDKTQQELTTHKIKNLTYYKVSKEERGLTKQRNYGIKRVSKSIEIVCFLDDDILLTTHYFKNLIATYSVYPNALAVGGYITNEIVWKETTKAKENDYYFEGWARKEPQRFRLRKRLGLIDETRPGWMPTFSNGRSISFLPPNGKIYQVEQLMGGVASYKKQVFKEFQFSKYFEGYGLYEDADFSLRLAKKGALYVNTSAQLEHHHHPSGRPNQFSYGKMVIRNGWYVWRVKYTSPSFISKFKWNAIALVLIFLRLVNVVTTNRKKEALTEALGRIYGLFTLLFNKPNVQV